MSRQTIFRLVGLALVALLVSYVGQTFAAPRALRSVSSLQQTDDTRANNNDQTETADQQKETASDRELARKIRQSIVEDKTLSSDGHQVKVTARQGEVTLKGPVKSENEKAAIEAKATAIAGTGKVRNQLIVNSPPASS